jgi:hypothetical protein
MKQSPAARIQQRGIVGLQDRIRTAAGQSQDFRSLGAIHYPVKDAGQIHLSSWRVSMTMSCFQQQAILMIDLGIPSSDFAG